LGVDEHLQIQHEFMGELKVQGNSMGELTHGLGSK